MKVPVCTIHCLKYQKSSSQLKCFMKIRFFTAVLLVSGSALANEACDKPKNDFDGLYCLNKIYQEADKELNSNYQILVPLLNSVGKSQLKSSQLSWLRSRNSNCSRREGDSFLIDMQCATDTTISRLQFLQDRIRECKSSGCLNSKL